MRRLLLLTVCFLTASVLFAGPVTKEQAQQLAQQFLQGKGMTHRAPSLDQMTTEVVLDAVDEEGHPYLYVVTQGKDNGFVIVSGSDLTAPIVGYSSEGTFDSESMPLNMRSWLQGYIEEIKWMEGNGIKTTSSTATRRAALKHSISPMLSSTWNQDSPYNDNCPYWWGSSERCVTGCVATAMAQIMYYHKFPEKTLKEKAAYDCATNWVDGQIHSEGFVLNEALEWAKMLPSYNGVDDTDAKAAVAKLMQICGASVDMDYANSYNGGSGASSVQAVESLKEYFGYEETARFVNRSDYSYSEWIDMMYAEMEAGRPILFSGQSTTGGHAFVVDGYDEEDYFHVNWGWGGKSNAFFKVSLMNPDDQGIGGSSTNGAYTMGQGMGIGIQKPTGLTPVSEPAVLTINAIGLYVDSSHQNESSSSIPLYGNGYALVPRISVSNVTGKACSFDHGIRLTKDGDSFTKDYLWEENKNISAGGGFSSLKSFMLNPSEDPGITDGTYKVVHISKENGTSDWIVDKGYEYNYITLTISGNTMNATAVSTSPVVSLERVGDPTFSSVNAEVGLPYTITLKVRNSGTKAYHGDIVMRSTAGKKPTLAGTNCDINAGETVDVVLTYTASSAGAVGVNITADDAGTELYTGTITAVAATPGVVDVSVQNVTTNKSGSYIYGNCLNLQFDLKNNSSSVAYVNGATAYICIVTKDLGGGGVSGVDVQTLSDNSVVAANGTKTYKFSFKNLNYGDRYWVNYGYYNGSGEFQYSSTGVFTVQHGIVSIDADGNVTGTAPTASYVAPANATAIDLRGQSTVTTVTPSSNPNCIYVLDAGAVVPSGLTKNIVKGTTAESIEITDNANGFVTPVDFTAAKITYTRTFNKFYDTGKGWTTIVLPFAATKVENKEGTLPWDVANRKFWLMEFSSETGSTVNFTTPTTLAANTPYIIALPGDDQGSLSLTAASKRTLTFSADNADIKANAKSTVTVSKYKFIGTMTNTGSLDDIYALNGDGDKFTKGTATVEPFRAYFAGTSAAATATSLGIGFGDGISTGIESLQLAKPEAKREGIYNLNGQRVSQPKKGLYIVNGKKVVIK